MNEFLNILLSVVIIITVILIFYCKATHKSIGEVFSQFKEMMTEQKETAVDNIHKKL